MPDNEDLVKRNVAKQNISNSFRGILRVSPDNEKGDIGFADINGTSIVTDSKGDPCPMELGTNLVNTHQLRADGKTDITDMFNIIGNQNNGDHYQYIDSKGNTTKVSLTKPSTNEILICDENGNYVRKNLWEIIASELRKFNIFNSIVPISTVFYTAMKSMDINNLPLQYREDYMIADGSSLKTSEYPDLFAVIGYTYGGSGANFNLPKITNRFIRGSSENPETITSPTEGTFTVPAHAPGISEVQQTNLYSFRYKFDGPAGTFWAQTTTDRDGASKWFGLNGTATGCVSVSQTRSAGSGRYRNGGAIYTKYQINLADTNFINNIIPIETAPNNISLVPIIKVRNSNVPDY